MIFKKNDFFNVASSFSNILFNDFNEAQNK